jgi:uncharacterized protein (TIGR02145 family)
MNKVLLTTIIFLSTGYLSINAQVFKNIYLSNSPTIHIPIQSIEKVENVLDSNLQKLKIIRTNGYETIISNSLIDSITHTQGLTEFFPNLGGIRTANVMGTVINSIGQPIFRALVKSAYSGEETFTDKNGVFFLNNISVFDSLGYITIEKPGFFKGSRSFLPLEQGFNKVEVQLFPKSLSGSFISSNGGVVTAGSLQITFLPNSIQQNGQLYNGTVNVFAKSLNPQMPDFFKQIPGDLFGVVNDSLKILRSFGMAAIEITDNNNQPLQLLEGASASLRFTIQSGLVSQAPPQIDWWSFDEERGFWKHEGVAIKQNNYYIGEASHFSWWNCDAPFNFVKLSGIVKDENGNPLSGVRLEVFSQISGTRTCISNSEGKFSGWVPKNQNLTLTIYRLCNTEAYWTTVNSQIINALNDSLYLDLTAQINNYYTVTGTLVNCAGQPVQSGYVLFGAQIFFTNNGDFSFQTCDTTLISLIGFDNSNIDSLRASALVQVMVESEGANAGIIETCEQVFGTVTDIDQNVYPTVLIGSQWWMAENLKTSRFSNGTLIPNITLDSEWAQINPPSAWCNFSNKPENDLIYGKIYNWKCAADVRHVCPVGWRTPNNDDWTTLLTFLGGDSLAGNKLKTTMPFNAPTGVELPGEGTTNESGFTALLGGYRSNYGGTNGQFVFEGDYAHFWSTTNPDFYLDSPYYLDINAIDGIAELLQTEYRLGKYIRCIKE